VALPGAVDGPTVPAGASLREVLSELLWQAAPAATVVASDGQVCGHLTVQAIFAHGHPRR
jgi:hypothetical protein